MSDKSTSLCLTPDAHFGPAMRNLNDRQRAFVVAMVETPDINFTRAALQAGYGNGNKESAAVQGHRLAHDQTILAAIREEADRRLRSGVIMAVQTVLEIASNPTAKEGDRLKACEMLFNRAGMHAVTEHNVKVEHKDVTDEGMIKRIKLLAERQGLDPSKLLGSAGVTIEAEFKEIVPEVIEDDPLEEIQDIL